MKPRRKQVRCEFNPLNGTLFSSETRMTEAINLLSLGIGQHVVLLHIQSHVSTWFACALLGTKCQKLKKEEAKLYAMPKFGIEKYSKTEV